MQSGLDQILKTDQLKGKRLGVVANQASVASDLGHILVHLNPYDVRAIFGPQHGLSGHTQDNMIEWEPDPSQPRVYSLYSEHRKPTPEMLADLDLLVFDVQDVGSRYYTFIWTLALCMEAAREQNLPVMVLDRPNPVGLTRIEGPGHSMEYRSFVGLYSLPVRHGMTVGEIALFLEQNHLPGVQLLVVPCDGMDRDSHFDLPWVMPSPNMPTLETAQVYPGMCLVEGTKLSEGRGTTRPFETFGAPFISGEALQRELQLPGVYLRPITFQPTFQKFASELCGGVFVHVLDPEAFEPVFTTISLLHTVRRLYGEQFEWLQPPYEYEYEKLPIDILTGGTWVREAIDQQVPLNQIRERMCDEARAFEPIRQAALIYD